MSWSGPQPAGNNGGKALTPQTQALLNDAMSKRGTSIRAAQDIVASVQRGDSDWVDSLNTNMSTQRASSSKVKPILKVPKVGSGQYGPQLGPALPGRFSGIKLRHEIERDNPSQREQYKGIGPGPDREAEKDRLSSMMELGQKGAAELQDRMMRMREAAFQRGKLQPQQVDVREAKIDQIIDEIQERCEFLESMRAAGKARQHEMTIQAEIRQRLQELNSLGLAAAAPTLQVARRGR